MNLKLQNITHVFKNVRTRSIIIVTVLILLFGFLLGFKHLINRTAPAADSSVQLKDAPSDIQSVPGGLQQSPSADYQRLQQQQNLQQAALAEKTGASVIPTLLDSSEFNSQSQNQLGGCTSCCKPCACCENNASSANKAFNASGASLLQPSDLRSGTLIYDTQGKAIGRLGPDGKVRNQNGEIIGQVGPDGLVRATDGSVIGSAAVPASGDPVYDATGHLIGHVGADGKVRDLKGAVIGTVSADGIVRDLKGAVIGKAVNAKLTNSGLGAAVYDAQGRMLGTVGSDGKVRDAKGNVIGSVGADGIVRDADGKVIGKTGVSSVGAPIYDAQGRLLGTVGADGKVRDAKGNVIGSVGADGTVRDADGKIIAKTGVSNVGAPVYDAQGRLLGTVGSDGKVRDAKGNVIGQVNADGVVQDANGKSIGRAYLGGMTKRTSSMVPGAPVYDRDGKIIGTVGSDGRVRDEHGKVLGTLSRDGTLRDQNQQLIGKVGATAPGTPVYDKQGRLVGTVGSDGIVRDSQGRVIASMGADGIARDAQANPLGSTTPPTSSALASNDPTNPNAALNQSSSVSLLPSTSDATNPALQAILDRQAQQISAQKAEQLQQQIQSSMSTQANQLFVAWGSPTQQYVAGTPSADRNLSLGSAGTSATTLTAGGAPPAVNAGTIMYAVLLTAVNSDEPGPVLAEIVQGKFKGARLIGTLSNQKKKVLLSFNTMTMPKLSQSIPINTVAIDDNTARTALSSYTDNHYWLRYGTLFASAFIQGYGQSFLASNANYSGAIVINPDNKAPDLKPRDRIFVGLGQVGVQYAAALGSIFNTPPTVHVYSGTAMGILFLSDLPALPQ
ncbi:component of the Dot/Icm secretion system. Major component of a channel [Candidatus Rickettsiella viridis]|uniref:Component of the Dot/Icm secretion system. Major component of a channel n=1 Tax=Candidatus Rickettsiella viridis TaxID=676208 RepID=A0A2Z5V3T9_9COXI|nr:TrbI/VirB10 family protein [Candidatus Rickettsiella viridis]BBB15112.1 component of the Dot/Icm secretion system. Major component of a channel [Candidatus Rickettsiella viridis]